MRDPLPIDPVTPINHLVVALLERKLAAAKAGRLTAVALITVGDELTVDNTGEPAAMIALLGGSVQLTHQIRKLLFPDAAQMQPPGTRLSS